MDASIMPNCIRANTSVTTMMIGERVADMIRGEEQVDRRLRARWPSPTHGGFSVLLTADHVRGSALRL